MKYFAPKIIAALGLASLVAADFHILTGPCSIAPGFGGELEDYVVACPSNYYNCDCINGGDRAGHLQDGDTPVDGITTTDSDYFQISGMCGVGAMNFYKNDDNSWTFYLDGGDGSVQGTCYAGDNSIKDCNSFSAACSVSNILVCYSYICNP
ncbi:hypothetical protein F5884DRAFT_317650 [Xylogone sp. PMI_703]|nr:hypothetical protein F5884DRAFT_317650 [Xylogone sp. PMI_703]